MHARGFRSALRLAVCMTGMLGAGTGVVSATTFTWNVGNGTYGAAGSWTPGGGPPVAGDTAQFSTAGGHTVTFGAAAASSFLDMTAGTVTFTASGADRLYTLSNVAGVHGAGLTLSGTTHQMQLNTSSLQVNEGSTLTIKEGNDAVATTLNVGDLTPIATSTLLVTGTGSTLTVSGLTQLGLRGSTGILTFQSGAQGTMAGIQLVNSGVVGSSAQINVESGSDVTSSGGLSFGSGSLTGQSTSVTVTGIGSTFTQTGTTSLTLGSTANSSAALHVNSNGTFTTGTGLMTINPTGSLTIAGGSLIANGSITVNGTLQQTSGAFTWAASQTMTIQNGGMVILSGGLTTPTGAVIDITGSGSQLTSTANVIIRNGAQVSIMTGGSLSTTQSLDIGNGSDGTVVVDGALSSISMTALGFGSSIGLNGGSGTLTIRNSASGTINSITMGGSQAQPGVGTINVQTGGSLTVPNSLSAGAGGGASGSGIINLSGGSITVGSLSLGTTFNSHGELHITGGTFNSGTSTTPVNATGWLDITGGTYVANGTLNVLLGGLLTLGGSTNNWAGTLDLKAGKLIFNTTTGNKAIDLARLQNQVTYGVTHATGITCSALPVNTVVAVIDNGSLSTPFTTFGGASVNNNSILIAPELLGDANVDGVVTFADFVVLSNHYGQANKGWPGADFNGDGTTNFADFVQLSNHYGQAFGSPSIVVGADDVAAFEAASAAFFAGAVPEPGTGLLAGLGVALAVARRRRRAW